DEIKFGDNDKLGALTASLLDVDLFIIATNTNGIYTKESIENGVPETINEVVDFNELRAQVVSSKSTHGSGGMQSKIEAAALTKKANIETWIVNGLEDNFIVNAMENKVPFTKIK
ncbi:MAG: glutamate 5-kinase, partial [Algibacter sp.]